MRGDTNTVALVCHNRSLDPGKNRLHIEIINRTERSGHV